MAEQPTDQELARKRGRAWHFWPVMGLGAFVAVFIVGLIMALVIAVVADSDSAANWISIVRDLFIIVLAMEGILMGIALIVMVLQLAALFNLLQNEIQPIVDNANETVTTVRGTAQFMSQNLVEPVVTFSAFAAALGGVLREALGIQRALREASKNGHQTEEPESEEGRA